MLIVLMLVLLYKVLFVSMNNLCVIVNNKYHKFYGSGHCPFLEVFSMSRKLGFLGFSVIMILS